MTYVGTRDPSRRARRARTPRTAARVSSGSASSSTERYASSNVSAAALSGSDASSAHGRRDVVERHDLVPLANELDDALERLEVDVVDLDLRMLDPLHDAVEAEDDRELRGERGVHAPASVRASAMRPASETASRPCARSASGGVPNAGQPSTPQTVTSRPGSSRRSASPSAPTEAWSSTTTIGADVAVELVEPLAVEAVEPGHVHDRHVMSVLREQLGGGQRLVQHHRAVREDDRVVALTQHGASSRARAGSRRASSMRRGDGPMASRMATLPSASSTAHVDNRLRLLGVRRLHDRHARQRGEQRDVAQALMRHAWAGGDQPRVVERVDHLRALARVVVDLLVRAGGEEARERVDDGNEGRGARARRPRTPCPARRCRTRGSAPGTPPRSRARGSRRRGRRRARRARGFRPASSTSASP